MEIPPPTPTFPCIAPDLLTPPPPFQRNNQMINNSNGTGHWCLINEAEYEYETFTGCFIDTLQTHNKAACQGYYKMHPFSHWMRIFSSCWWVFLKYLSNKLTENSQKALSYGIVGQDNLPQKTQDFFSVWKRASSEKHMTFQTLWIQA
jgi:hypothetical protein